MSLRYKAPIIAISPARLTAEEKKLLDKFTSKVHNEGKEEMLQAALAGFCQIWRIPNGIVVTEIIERWGERQLWFSFLAGKGVLKLLDDLEPFFLDYGKRHGCKKVIGDTPNKAMQRIYARRWKELSRTYGRDL